MKLPSYDINTVQWVCFFTRGFADFFVSMFEEYQQHHRQSQHNPPEACSDVHQLPWRKETTSCLSEDTSLRTLSLTHVYLHTSRHWLIRMCCICSKCRTCCICSKCRTCCSCSKCRTCCICSKCFTYSWLWKVIYRILCFSWKKQRETDRVMFILFLVLFLSQPLTSFLLRKREDQFETDAFVKCRSHFGENEME